MCFLHTLVSVDMKKSLAILLMCFLVASFSYAQEEEQKPLIKSIYFGGGSYGIDEGQAQDVYEWLEGIENIHMYQINIKSHTDNIGSKSFNQYLSEMRSESALRLLKQFPTTLSNISIADYGEQTPDFKNDSWEGKQRNRRVDIILLKVNS